MPRRPQSGRIPLDTTTYDAMLGNSTSGLTELDIAKLLPYPDHPFKLYKGERLDKMVESVREHGVLEPVIVRLKHDPDQDTDLYIILSGHNRVNAAKIVGLATIPVRIMDNLSEAKARLIVTETNLHQRSFTDLSHSERALAIHSHYTAIKEMGENVQFIEEIESMCRVPSGNGGRSINKTCKEFGASQGTIARYLRIYKLIPSLKEQMDDQQISVRAGEQLSWISLENQQTVSEITSEKGIKITVHQAAIMRECGDELNKESIRKILCSDAMENNKPYGLTVSRSVISQYFPENTKKKEIAAIVEKALAMYFEQNTAEAV